MTLGLIPRSAQALAEAGYRALTGLIEVTQEELLAIPGVGAATLAALEEVLGRPIPSEGRGRTPPPASWPWAEMVWRQRGLPPSAAITFAQEGMTLERLSSISREELVGMTGVGPGALEACERLVGKKILSRRTGPGEAFWLGQGFSLNQARALSQAGIDSIEDLRKLPREEVVALRGVGENALERLEVLLGSAIPSRSEHWLRRGLAPWLANALVRARISSLSELAALSREQFLSLPGLGLSALWQCERLLGHKL
ncbi:MAG TPA: helix-hairpin-helix domain-containing protein [Thermoanaerobaculia bacterium]|nr:helix-hairpin-helix domain-containing protein [Thermoanaerobaculia bacterium]